jgi:hypothetical protein
MFSIAVSFFCLNSCKKQELMFFNNKNSRFGAVLGGVFAFCGVGVAKKSSNAFLLEK